MESRSGSNPEFDWRSEQSAQKRDLSRFGAELGRVLSLRAGVPAVRQTSARLRDRWEQLIRRLEGRWARGGDLWDRHAEQGEHLRRDSGVLETLIEYVEQLAAAGDVDQILLVTLQAVARAIACEGAMIYLADWGGQPRWQATQRRRGRFWPPAADRELCEEIARGAHAGRRITIEGRPVKAGPQEQNRTAHWLGVGIHHGADAYGAIVIGSAATAEPFTEEEAVCLERVARFLAHALAARLGIGVRPALGVGTRPEGFEHLWGESSLFRQALALAMRFAQADSPVVIEGEMGTGRQTLARAIHRRSRRAERPFVVFRGSDLPEDVVARGLFGEMSVAPDGQKSENPGDLEMAEGGTLFIDDLAALDSLLQVRLLRVLSERVYERVGDRSPRHADVRLIMATSVPIEGLMSQGRLRQDLYYQITAARLSLTPLRERGGDAVELARRFAIAAGQKVGKSISGIDAEAARLLAAAPLPGNVRQLMQVVERAVLLATGPVITAADLPRDMTGRMATSPLEVGAWTEQATRAVRQAGEAGHAGDYGQFRRARKLGIVALDAAFTASVLKAVGRHPSRAARHLGIHRAQWWRLWHGAQETGATPAPRDGADGDKS